MRTTHWALYTPLFALLSAYGCSCGDDRSGMGTDAGSDTGTGPGTDTGTDRDGNVLLPDLGFDEDGNAITPDSGVDGDGNVITADTGLDGDGNVLTGDGGNPLEQPLSDFCRGEGTVVVVGASGECAGEIAQNTFQFGVCACETLHVQSTLSIDAFDSRLGSYGATIAGGAVNVQEDGHLGINGALDMDGKLTVLGVAFIGGGGFSVGSQSLVSSTTYANGDAVQEMSSTTLGRNAFFNGDVIGRYDIAGDLHLPMGAVIDPGTTVGGMVIREMIPDVNPCPCLPNEILDVAALTAFGRTHNDNAVNNVLTSTTWENGTGPNTIVLPCGRYYLTRINHSGPLSIRAEGRTVLFVDGDMAIDGSFSLELAEDAEVDLFVAGSLSVGASARFGEIESPSKVRTYVGGSGTIDLGASAIFGGNLYAPRAAVVFNASANLYGALFARTATFTGSADVHFDSAVRAAGQECEEPVPADGGVPDLGFDDMGRPIDGGVAPVDAGPEPGDGAPMPEDAAPGPEDAGPGDGAPQPGDGGPGPGDAGPAPVDAGGGMGCTGCGQCGELACLIDPGQMSGVCGPCVDDLDCCAPNVCIAGMCMINI